MLLYNRVEPELTDSFYAIVHAFSSIHARDLIREMCEAGSDHESLEFVQKIDDFEVNGVI